MTSPIPDALDALVERFDHISLAVWDIEATTSLVGLMGGSVKDGGDVPAKGFRWAQFDLPGPAKLEMIQPLDRDDANNFLVKFLARNGEGIHHVTLKVVDIAAAMNVAAELGFDLVEVDLSSTNWKEAFIHPRSAHGVLIQLAEWQDLPDIEGLTLEHIATGIPDRYA